MGDLIMGVCKCGYEVRDIYLGVGMMGGAACSVCYCDECEDVQQIPLYESPKICDKCKNNLTPYVKISGEDDDKEIDFTGGDSDSKGIYYHCPKCKTNNLMFHCVGIWD